MTEPHVLSRAAPAPAPAAPRAPDASAASPRRTRRVPRPGAVLVVGAVAFAVRLWLLLQGGGGLDGSYGYDNGVYFAAATALVWGRMPYADFVLLHPPGIVLVLSPFAALGRITTDSIGFEVARVAWILLGAVNAMLVVRVARRWGTAAAVVGGLFYALWPPAAQTEENTRLEPLVSLGLLVALALLLRPRGEVSSRRLLVAGAALGFAACVKIWGFLPLVVLLVWCARRWGVRACLRMAAGAAAAAVVACLPFFVWAPATMFRMVVQDQTGRDRSALRSWSRLDSMFGFLPVQAGARATVMTAVIGALVLVLVVVAAQSHKRGVGLVMVLLAAETTLLLVAPSYFTFYAAFLAPVVALAVGCGAGVLLTRPWGRRWRGARTPVAAVALLGIALVYVDATATVGIPVPASQLRDLVAGSRCVTADAPEALLLSDALNRNLAHGCPLMVDVMGLTHDVDAPTILPSGRPTPPGANKAFQRDLGRYLLSGQRILLAPSLRVVSPAVRWDMASRPVLLLSPAYVLWGRPLAPGPPWPDRHQLPRTGATTLGPAPFE